MKSQTEYTMELALIVGLSRCHTDPENEKRSVKFSLFEDAVWREINKLPKLNDAQVRTGKERLAAFDEAVGWTGQKRHMMTFLSFVGEIIRCSRFRYPDSIKKALNNVIYDYEDSGEFYSACCVAGKHAYRKWARVVYQIKMKSGYVISKPVKLATPKMIRDHSIARIALDFDPGKICIPINRSAV